MSQYTDMSDSELDAAYDAARVQIQNHSYDYQTVANACADEIVNRLTSVWGFVGSLAGSSRFPLYEKWTHFVPSTEARVSVADSTAAAAGAVVDTVKTVAYGSLGLVLVVAVAAYVLIYQGKVKL